METENLESILNKKPNQKIEATPLTAEEDNLEGKKISPIANIEKDEIKEKDFGERLDDLKEAVTEMNKHGEEITEDIFENIMDMPFKEFRSYVDGGKIIQQKDLKNFHQQVSEIINGDFNSNYEGNRFRNVINKPVSRALFAAVCLFLKFAPTAQAHDNESLVKDKAPNDTEVKIQNDLDGAPDSDRDDNQTYKFNTEKINPSELKEAALVNITQGFEVDKASVSEIEAQKIAKEIDSFINKLNIHNFEEFNEAKKIIYGSSDSRATKYGAEDKKLAPTLENNIKLSTDRCLKGMELVKNALENHDYSKSSLTQEQIEKIKNTELEFKIPEKGYTKITELNEINPKTGEKYTEQDVKEIEKNNPALYKELNDKCRYVKLDLMVESTWHKVSESDRVIIFADNTNSTEYTMDAMAKKLEELGLKENSKGNVPKADLIYYANNANPVKHLSNVLEAANDLKQPHAKDGSIENPFQSSIGYLNELIKHDSETAKKGGEVEDYRTLIYTTDEGLQEAQNIFEAAKLAKEANVKDANIFLYTRGNEKPLEKNLFELSDEVEKIIKAKLDLNLAKAEQAKQNEEQNLNQLVSEANEKVSPKTLKEFFGEDRLNIENGTIKILDKNHEFSKLQKTQKPSAEKIILQKLFKSINSLEKADKLFGEAQKNTFENYVKTTQIKINVFTGNNGEKVKFDVLGGTPLAQNAKVDEIKL